VGSKSHIEIAFEVTQAQAQCDFVRLRNEPHKERYGCILSEKFYEQFSAEARALVADQDALEEEIENLKIELKRKQNALKSLQTNGNRMAVQLLSKPPQGEFFFTGDLHVIRSTMHCILIDPSDGEPILESYRKLTDSERAEFSKLDEAMREEMAASRQTTIHDFIKPKSAGLEAAAEATESEPPEGGEEPDDSEEDPFAEAPAKNRLN